MPAEDYVRVFPAKACIFVRVTPRLVAEIREMSTWPLAECKKWMHRLMYPRHWTSLSEQERQWDPHHYVSYKEALGQECPAYFPVLAKDLSQRDMAQMSLAESLQKLHYRYLPWHSPLDGDGPKSCFLTRLQYMPY